MLPRVLKTLGLYAWLVAIPFTWLAFGSAFIALKVGLASAPPFLFSGSRFVVAGAVLLGWMVLRTGGRLGVDARDLALAGGAGVGMILAGQGGATWAIQYLAPGMVAVLSSTMPIWAAVISRLLFGSPLSALAGVGLVAGLGGVAFLAWPAGGAQIQPLPAVVATAGALGWAAGSLIGSRSEIGRRRPLLLTSFAMLSGGLLQVVFGLAMGEGGRVSLAQLGPSAPAWLYLVLIPALVGFPVLIWLFSRVQLEVVNTIAYAVPVVALLLGWLLLGEQVTGRTLIAVAVILGGVALIVWSARHVETRSEAEPEPGAAAA
jgi:drug/metabolite transporter (DMT)-like permease